MMKYMINSNLTIAFNLNPMRWGFSLDYFGPDDEGGEEQPKTYFWYAKVLCFVFMVIITDGDL